MLTTANKNVVERVDHPETVVQYTLKTDEQYYKECMRSVRCKLLTEAGYYESRSESDKGVAAVLHVILNRVKHPNMWASTISGVISQPWQFSYKHDGSLEKGFTDKKQYRRIAVIAKKVLDGEIGSPVGLATYYHTKQVKPVWREKLTKIGSIGRHIFYK
jgi:spore germination cell wall hydrolase CwlJ-like protein